MATTLYQQSFAEHFFLAFHFSVNGQSPNLDACESFHLGRAFAMAPGLVDPPQPVSSPVTQKDLTGPKEAFIGGPSVYSKDNEEKGTERHPPATHPNYLPIWDAETK